MPMIKKVVDYNGKIMNASVYEGDYTLARKFGKVMVGKRALYYQDGLKIVCVPFDKMDRVFTRVVGGTTTMCCGGVGYEYYRLVVVYQEKEIASIIVGEDGEQLEQAEAYLKEVNPNVEIGYIAPEEK